MAQTVQGIKMMNFFYSEKNSKNFGKIDMGNTENRKWKKLILYQKQPHMYFEDRT